LKVSSSVQPPVPSRKVRLRVAWTKEQLAAAKEAYSTSAVRCVVSKTGEVHDVRVFRSMGEPFDALALEAVRQWTFKPATKDGIPVNVGIAIEVQFE
jgi:TonB family protein